MPGKGMPQNGAREAEKGTPAQEGTGATTNGTPTQNATSQAENDTSTQNEKKQALRKPTHKERREKILEILERYPYINKQTEVREKLEGVFGVPIEQTYVSKDFAALGIQKNDDGSFAVSESYIRSENVKQLKKIADDCGFYNADVCTEFKTLIIKSYNLAYSHMLSQHLKAMYPNVIIDTVCSENSVIIYHIDSFAFGKKTLDEDIFAHLPDPE